MKLREADLCIGNPTSDSTVAAARDAASFDSDSKTRDRVIRSGKYLDVDRFPDMAQQHIPSAGAAELPLCHHPQYPSAQCSEEPKVLPWQGPKPHPATPGHRRCSGSADQATWCSAAQVPGYRTPRIASHDGGLSVVRGFARDLVVGVEQGFGEQVTDVTSSNGVDDSTAVAGAVH